MSVRGELPIYRRGGQGTQHIGRSGTPAGGRFSPFLSATIHRCPNSSICLCFSHLCFELGWGGKKGGRQHRFYLGAHFVEET